MNIENLTPSQLKPILRARLLELPADTQGVLDSCSGVDGLAEYYRQSAILRRRCIDEALWEMLTELADVDQWSEESAFELLDLVQEIGDSIRDQLFELAESQALVDRQNLHAGLLNCLISTGCRATPEFWRTQEHLIAPECRAVIASGLCDHGLDVFFAELPSITQNETARDGVSLLWTHMVGEYGLAKVASKLSDYREQLGPTTYRYFRDDLKELGYQPMPSSSKSGVTSISPVNLALIQQAQNQHYSPFSLLVA